MRAPGVSGKIYRTYAINDEQSNQSFGTLQLFDYLGVDSKLHDYSITTLNDTKSRHVGRVVNGLVIRGVTEEREYSLPSLYENNNIPDTKYEATTPNMLKAHPSLQYLSDKFPPIDETAATTLLIGRDAVDLMVTKVIENTSPVVHHTVLGWAIVGSLSMTGSRSNSFMALRSELLSEHFSAKKIFPQKPWSVFDRFRDDEMIGFSVEDKRFISIMENNVCVNEKGNIQMPLPFRKENQILPDNSRAVFGRMKGTLSRLSLDKGKLEKCVSSMQFSISAGHVEEVPRGELTL